MKNLEKLICSILMAVPFCELPAYGQPFINLDFELAHVGVTPAGQYGNYAPISLAFPGWTVTDGFGNFTEALQNDLTLGTASIDILGPNFPSDGIIQGKYTAVLQAGDDVQGNVSVTLQQTGQIPSSAKSILFDASDGLLSGINFFSVEFDGHNLPLFSLAPDQNFEEYGVDISAYAGQTGQLSFSVNPVPQNHFTDRILIIFPSHPIQFPSLRHPLYFCSE